MMILSRREKIIVTLIIIMIVVTLGDKFLITPSIKKWRVLNRRLQEIDADLMRSQVLLSREDQIRRQWQDLTESPRILAEGKDLLSSLSKYLAGLAKEAGISFTETKPIIKSELDYTKVVFDIKFAAPIGGLSKFLYQLNISPELIKLLDLKVSSPRGDSGDLKVEIRLSTVVIKKT